MQVTIKDNKSGRSITVEYDIGNSLDEAVEKFGEDVVWQAAKSELLTSVRDRVRPKLVAGTSDDEIRADVATYKLGERASRITDPLAKIKSLLAKLPPDKRAAFEAILNG